MAQCLVSAPWFLRGGSVVPYENSGLQNKVAAGLTRLKCNGTYGNCLGKYHSISTYKRQQKKFRMSVLSGHVAAVLGEQKLTAAEGNFNPETVEEAISQVIPIPLSSCSRFPDFSDMSIQILELASWKSNAAVRSLGVEHRFRWCASRHGEPCKGP